MTALPKSIHEFSAQAIDVDAEADLWRRFGACADQGTYLIDGKKDEIEALIRGAHIVVEHTNEIVGLYVTQQQFKTVLRGVETVEPRFLWISHISAGQHAGEVCMADECRDVEFRGMQFVQTL